MRLRHLNYSILLFWLINNWSPFFKQKISLFLFSKILMFFSLWPHFRALGNRNWRSLSSTSSLANLISRAIHTTLQFLRVWDPVSSKSANKVIRLCFCAVITEARLPVRHQRDCFSALGRLVIVFYEGQTQNTSNRTCKIKPTLGARSWSMGGNTALGTR